ncbi:type II toxin-antitoxin system HigB family toxin [Nodularia chucula]|uniref:type II toxin-antitoxin system HigB family toxin n=1 Tax=Nodularia chucula TaxID=3093667 RepID=UPI0039C66B6C
MVELRQTFSSADQVGNFTVFNIGGNNYRLITLVDYKFQKVFIRHVLTHAEYDKEDWKNDPWLV